MIDSWKCHICGQERLDNKISVFTKPLMVRGQKLGDQNIRYCNDNPECCKKVAEHNFI